MTNKTIHLRSSYFDEIQIGHGKDLVLIAGPCAIESRDHSMRMAEMMVKKAAALFEAGEPCGPEANMAKMLASEASWEAGDTCMQTFGGFGFAEEYDVERKFRETRLYRTAPISTNMILAYVGQHVLGMPRSY